MGAPLILRIATDTSQASRGVQQLTSSIVSNMQSVNAAIGTVSQLALPGLTAASAAAANALVGNQQSIIGVLGRSTLAFLELRAAWIVGGVAIAAALAGARDELQRFTDIIDKAKQADVSNGFFQAFIKSADEAKVKTEILEKALIQVRARILPELDGGGSSLPSDPQKLLDNLFLASPLTTSRGSSAPSDFRAAQSEEDRVRALLVAVRDLNAAYKETGDIQSRLAGIKVAELFGPDFADQVRRGNVDLDSFIANLDRIKSSGVNSGDIIADETLNKVKELDDRIAAADRRIRDALRPAFDDLATAILSIRGVGVYAFEQLAALVGQVGELYVRTKELLSLLGSIPKRIVTDATNALTGSGVAGETTYDQLGNPIYTTSSQQQVDQIQAAEGLKSLQRTLDRPSPNIVIPRPIEDPRPENDRFQKLPKAASPDTSRQDQIDRYIEQLEKEVRVVEAEAASFGKSNEEKARANAIARIGTEEVTPKQIKQIEDLATRQAKAKDATEQLRQAQENYNNAVRFAGSAVSGFLSDVVSGGKNAEEAISNLVKRLADAVLQAELLGDGPLASVLGTKAANGAVGGLFGQIFSGFSPGSQAKASPSASFANGGIMSAYGPLALNAYSTGGVATGPQLALFGEGANNEAFVPLPDGRSIPVSISAPAVRAAGSGGISVVINRAPLAPDVSTGVDGSVVIDFGAAMAKEAANPSSQFFRALAATTGLRATGALR